VAGSLAAVVLLLLAAAAHAHYRRSRHTEAVPAGGTNYLAFGDEDAPGNGPAKATWAEGGAEGQSHVSEVLPARESFPGRRSETRPRAQSDVFGVGAFLRPSAWQRWAQAVGERWDEWLDGEGGAEARPVAGYRGEAGTDQWLNGGRASESPLWDRGRISSF